MTTTTPIKKPLPFCVKIKNFQDFNWLVISQNKPIQSVVREFIILEAPNFSYVYFYSRGNKQQDKRVLNFLTKNKFAELIETIHTDDNEEYIRLKLSSQLA